MWDVLGRDDPLLSGPVRVVTALPLGDGQALNAIEAFAGGTADVLGRDGVTINRLVIALPVPGVGSSVQD